MLWPPMLRRLESIKLDQDFPNPNAYAAHSCSQATEGYSWWYGCSRSWWSSRENAIQRDSTASADYDVPGTLKSLS